MDKFREELESFTEEQARLKDGLSDQEVKKIEDYFTDMYDCVSDDPDAEHDRFMNWFSQITYAECLDIINK